LIDPAFESRLNTVAAEGKEFASTVWIPMARPRFVLLTLIAAAAAVTSISGQQREGVFQAGVDLVRITATVTDTGGRFIPGLRREDFAVFEDGVRQDISQFSSERAPVSLGILLDVSGSMTSDKMDAAHAAIDRFIFDLLGKDDELFFVEFAGAAAMTQDWTKDRGLISQAVRNVRATGDTALYDAIATAVPKAETGQHRKKALLVISDGNDSDSSITLNALQQTIRESEVLVYALGIDSDARDDTPRQPPRLPLPQPFPPSQPFPQPRRPPGIELPRFPPQSTPPIAQTFPRRRDNRVNGDALRRITDDTGGLTEIVRGAAGLSGATARIADELSRQYDLGYASNREKDGKWHAIQVQVPGRRATVRARTGFFAS
jgi:VWFA-related protein